MLQRDYILRMLERFFQDLNKYLNGDNFSENEQQNQNTEELYRKYLKEVRSFFIENTFDDSIAFLLKDKKSLVAIKSEIVGEWLVVEARKSQDFNLLKKALDFLEYASENDKTFSLQREQRIIELKKNITTQSW